MGAAWGAIPGLLRAFAHTNEIITSLMLNYCAALVLNYLIFDSLSYRAAHAAITGLTRRQEAISANIGSVATQIGNPQNAYIAVKSGIPFLRYLTVMGFFTTLEGMKDLNYVGNMPAAEWKGPSDEVLKRLGLSSG